MPLTVSASALLVKPSFSSSSGKVSTVGSTFAATLGSVAFGKRSRSVFRYSSRLSRRSGERPELETHAILPSGLGFPSSPMSGIAGTPPVVLGSVHQHFPARCRCLRDIRLGAPSRGASRKMDALPLAVIFIGKLPRLVATNLLGSDRSQRYNNRPRFESVILSHKESFSERDCSLIRRL